MDLLSHLLSGLRVVAFVAVSWHGPGNLGPSVTEVEVSIKNVILKGRGIPGDPVQDATGVSHTRRLK